MFQTYFLCLIVIDPSLQLNAKTEISVWLVPVLKTLFFLNTEKRNLFLRLSAGEHVLVAEYKVHHECRSQVSNPSNSTTVFAGLNPSVQIRIPSNNSMAFWIRVRNTDHHPGTGYLKKHKICFFKSLKEH